jgi:hypothetical protein
LTKFSNKDFKKDFILISRFFSIYFNPFGGVGSLFKVSGFIDHADKGFSILDFFNSKQFFRLDLHRLVLEIFLLK